MSVRGIVAVLVGVVPSVVPASAYSQAPSPLTAAVTPEASFIPGAKPHRKVRGQYDAVADSTRWSVVTHKGRYFLTIQRPRLTWSAAYAGHRLDTQSPREVLLEFRTQEPQAALDSRLVIGSADGERLEVGSSGAYSDPGVLTWSHFMRFQIPCSDLARMLASADVTVTVGGISEQLKPDHVQALRSLLEQVGSWPRP